MNIEKQKKIAAKAVNLLKGINPEDKIATAILIAAEIQKDALVAVTTEAMAKMITEAKNNIDEKVAKVENIEKIVTENSKNSFIIKEALTHLKNNKEE